MVDKLSVIIVDSFGVQHQLVQVVYVLLYDIRDIVKLSKFMPVVITKHALWADYGVTKLAEVFDLFVLVLEAEDLACARLGYRYLRH